jgi:hypothetical protein
VTPNASPIPTRQNLLRVVPNSTLIAQDEQLANDQEQARSSTDDPVMTELASHIRTRMTEMRNFRNTEGIAQRLIDSLRTYKGQYDPAKLQEIKKFGGSEVYARVTSTKCRSATALLRDVYLGADRPWDIAPTPVPKVPDNINQAIDQLVSVEVQTLQQSGQPIDQQMIADRVAMLRKSAERAAKKQATEEAERSGAQIDDMLTEGGFYEALAEFLIDLPIFPFACLKGPVVRREPQLQWVNGQAQLTQVPKMFWYRVSPFDLYWSPGAANVHQAEFVERIRLTRSDLHSVRGLPGYNDDAIDQVLTRYHDMGFREWWDVTDAERARLENREEWARTSSGLIDTAEYHGSVSGQTLIDWGMDEASVPDKLQEYKVQAWLIDRFVIKAQINPSPRQRAPYFISNFEKIPGTMAGYGLHDLLDDIQSVSNAAVRSLVNNLSISSGPQVVINDQVLGPTENDEMYPWKRWHVNFDPMITGTSKPIDFFQPNSNAQELLGIYEKFSSMADDVSAIPRYMTGNEKVGGAGRTASGLAMLMGNAAKTLQNVAASIDRDVMEPMLQSLFDMVMLTMPGMFRGDEKIVVKGVNHAVKREQDRMRQLEFLQLTGNPIDMQIVGMEGRANVIRSVAGNLGLDHEKVVPDDETLRAQQMAAQQQAAQQAEGGDPEAQGSNGQGPNGNQPKPKPQRAGPEAAREQVEGQQNNNATGSVGMRNG